MRVRQCAAKVTGETRYTGCQGRVRKEKRQGTSIHKVGYGQAKYSQAQGEIATVQERDHGEIRGTSQKDRGEEEQYGGQRQGQDRIYQVKEAAGL